MLIEWSNRDHQYVVTLPEWEAAGWSGHTGAKTYEAAAKRGRNMIENYIVSGADKTRSRCPNQRSSTRISTRTMRTKHKEEAPRLHS